MFYLLTFIAFLVSLSFFSECMDDGNTYYAALSFLIYVTVVIIRELYNGAVNTMGPYAVNGILYDADGSYIGSSKKAIDEYMDKKDKGFLYKIKERIADIMGISINRKYYRELERSLTRSHRDYYDTEAYKPRTYYKPYTKSVDYKEVTNSLNKSFKIEINDGKGKDKSNPCVNDNRQEGETVG